MRQLPRQLAARGAGERLHDAEGDVRRIVVRGIRVRHVERQRADRGRARGRGERLASGHPGGVQTGEQARGRRLDVPFDARHLPRKEHRRMLPDLPRLGQHRRAVDVRIPVHHAEADEFRLLQPGNQAQHPRLLAPFELRLKPDEAVVIARQVVLPQLHGRVRRPARSRIGEADRLHGPESQRVQAAVRHHFDRQAALEELLLVEVVDRRRLGVDQRVVEALVLLARQRAVQIVALAVVDAAGRSSRVVRRIRLRGVRRRRSGFSRTVDRLRSHRDARNTLPRSMLSASTIGLMAS